MPRFDLDAAAAFAQTDALFGEDFVVRPYAETADKRAAPAPDPTRDVVSLKGVWITKLADPREPNAYDQREYRRPGTISANVHVEFSPAATGAFVGLQIKSGDRIDRLSTNTAYSAQTPFFTPNGLMRVPLNWLGAIPDPS